MNRIKGRPERVLVQKKYVMNKQVFEFGPLLINKDSKLRVTDAQFDELPDADKEGLDADTRALAIKTNSETFRISNAGKTPAHIDFSFEKDGVAEDPKAKAAGGLDTSCTYYA